MKNIKIISLIVGCLLFGINAMAQSDAKKESRALYTYSFGGLEKMEVDEVVETLVGLNYGGIAAEARGDPADQRLDLVGRQFERAVGVTRAARVGRRGIELGDDGVDDLAQIDGVAEDRELPDVLEPRHGVVPEGRRRSAGVDLGDRP